MVFTCQETNDRTIYICQSSNISVPLKDIYVLSTVNGFIANVEFTLVYQNEEDNPIEAIFTFPLDEKSAIYRFEAEIEGRLIIGECQDKDQVGSLKLCFSLDAQIYLNWNIN